MVYRRSLVLCGVFAITPVQAQFGVPGKKRGTGFQEMNEMAKEQFGSGGGLAGLDVGALGDLSGVDPEDMQKLISKAMQDPEMMEMMKNINSDVEGAMEELAKLTPDKLAEQMKEAMEVVTSGTYLDKVLENSEDLIRNLEASGMVDAATLEEFRKDPAKLEQEMKAAMTQLKDLFEDPEALSTATQIAQTLTEFMQDPAKLQEALSDLSKEMDADLSDDDKIEEARLQLLANPDLAGNPELAALFTSAEMQDVLKDPVKWRESVKKGKGMMFDGIDGAAAAI